MKIGRKAYYELITGNIILVTSEMQGSVIPTTLEQDFFNYNELKDRNKETIGVIKLDYGQYAQDFATCNGYRVNLNTKQLEFSYPNPENPTEPPVFQKPLSEQVKDLKSENSILRNRVNQIDTDIAEFMEFILG